MKKKNNVKTEIAVAEGVEESIVQIETPRDMETKEPIEDKVAISVFAKGDCITFVLDKEELDL